MSTIPRLHDSTLETCTIFWEEGVVTVRLSTGINGTGVVLVKASGVVNFLCPRRSPWGPSDSVNEVRVQKSPEGSRLEIEMQSGDTLTITCDDIAYTPEE